MGLMSFIKEAGEKLFGKDDPEKAAAEVATAPDPAAAQARLAAANENAARAIEKYIDTQGLKVDGLQVAFDGTTCQATVSGCARGSSCGKPSRSIARFAIKENVMLS